MEDYGSSDDGEPSRFLFCMVMPALYGGEVYGLSASGEIPLAELQQIAEAIAAYTG